MELHPIPKVEIPWHTVHIDISGKLSGKNDTKEYEIVQIDAFTKFVHLYHTLHLHAENCIKAVKSIISLFRVPNRIIADQGRSFSCGKFRELCSMHKIELHLIATGAIRANGLVERVMSTMKSMLTAVEIGERSWQDAVSEVQLAMNCTTNRVTKYSPLEILIGREARLMGLLPINEETKIDCKQARAQDKENIEINAKYEKNRVDKNKAKIVKHKVGDHVLLRSEERHQTKMDPKFKGPFVVAELLEGDRYLLKSLTSKRTYKYSHESLRRLPDEQISDETIEESDSGEKDTRRETSNTGARFDQQ